MPRRRVIRSLVLPAALAAAVGLLAACSPAPTAASLPEGLTVEIKQGRFDVADKRLVVRYVNASETPVTIESFTVRTPTIEPGLERSTPVELGVDDAIDLRLDLPASDCDAEPGPVVVDLTYRADEVSGSAELVADDPFDTVALINGADCLAASVAEVATIVMPEHLRSTGTGTARRAFIDVTIEPAASGDASMQVERVYGTTLLNAEDGTDWPLGLEVAAGDEPLTVSLAVRPARCDAHAIADDKRGTILPFEIATSDGRAGRLDMPADDVLKAELYAYYGERCGLEPPAG